MSAGRLDTPRRLTEHDKALGIEICKRWPVDLADVQMIIEFVRADTLGNAPIGKIANNLSSQIKEIEDIEASEGDACEMVILDITEARELVASLREPFCKDKLVELTICECEGKCERVEGAMA